MIDRANPVLSILVNSIATLADERYSNDLDFKARTEAALAVVCDALWVDEQNRLEQATTHAELISIGGEVYKKWVWLFLDDGQDGQKDLTSPDVDGWDCRQRSLVYKQHHLDSEPR